MTPPGREPTLRALARPGGVVVSAVPCPAARSGAAFVHHRPALPPLPPTRPRPKRANLSGGSRFPPNLPTSRETGSVWVSAQGGRGPGPGPGPERGRGCEHGRAWAWAWAWARPGVRAAGRQRGRGQPGVGGGGVAARAGRRGVWGGRPCEARGPGAAPGPRSNDSGPVARAKRGDGAAWRERVTGARAPRRRPVPCRMRQARCRARSARRSRAFAP